MQANWQIAQVDTLLTDTLDIWYVDLNDHEVLSDHDLATLSDSEHKRAQRLIRASDRSYFIATRIAVRRILAAYLQRQPESLHFATGAQGKPFLPDQPIFFNLSHSYGVLLLAICAEYDIGVDVERTALQRNELSLAKRFFAEGEFARLRAQAKSWQVPCFYQLWTAKEAYAKAQGHSLSAVLGDDLFVWDDQRRLHFASNLGNSATKWRLQNFVVIPNYQAAVVYPPQIRQQRYLQFVW